MQHRRAARDPAALGDQVGARQLSEQAVAPGGVPVDLLVVRAGDHHHLPRDPRAGARRRRSSPDRRTPPTAARPSRRQRHRPAVHGRHVRRRSGASAVSRRRDLRHRPVIRAACHGGVLARMTGLAGVWRRRSRRGRSGSRTVRDLRLGGIAWYADGWPPPWRWPSPLTARRRGESSAGLRPQCWFEVCPPVTVTRTSLSVDQQRGRWRRPRSTYSPGLRELDGRLRLAVLHRNGARLEVAPAGPRHTIQVTVSAGGVRRRRPAAGARGPRPAARSPDASLPPCRSGGVSWPTGALRGPPPASGDRRRSRCA